MDAYLRHGNRELILLNGHFENAAFLAEAADRLAEAYSQRGVRVRIYLLSYWDSLDTCCISMRHA
jgi:creatinine amidohydrolase